MVYIEYNTVANIFDNLIRKLDSTGYHICDKREGKDYYNHFHYIPLNNFRFLEALNFVSDYLFEKDLELPYQNFLDVGCGIGTKVVLAKSFFGRILSARLRKSRNMEFIGIDYDNELIKRGKLIFEGIMRYGDIKLKKANGLTYDYSKYGIIYFYVPIPKCSLQIRLERRIKKQIPVGSILIGFRAKDCDYHGSYDGKITIPDNNFEILKDSNNPLILRKVA